MAIEFDAFNTAELTIIYVYLFILAILGTVVNGIILYLYAATKSLRTPMNALFINLTVGDFLVCLLGTLPSAIYTAAQVKMGRGICQAYGFITFLGGSADGIGLTVIAIERYLTVARPFNVGGLSYNRAAVWIGYTWFMSTLCAGLPLVGLSRYTGEGAGTWCSIDWSVKEVKTDIYVGFIFVMDYFFPIIIIVLCYYFVVDKVAQVAKTGASASSVKAQKAVTMQAIAMIVGYVIAWTPYAIVCLVVSITGRDPFGPKLAVIPPLFAKTSYLYNAFIYVGLNNQFRQAFIKTVLRGYNPFAKVRNTKISMTKAENGAVSITRGETTANFDTNTVALQIPTISKSVDEPSLMIPTISKSVDKPSLPIPTISKSVDKPSLSQRITGNVSKVSPQ